MFIRIGRIQYDRITSIDVSFASIIAWIFVRLKCSPCHFFLILCFAHLFSLTSLFHFLTHTHTHIHTLSCWLSVTSLPLYPSLRLSCPLSQFLWPLNIIQAVSAKLWMSLDTYSTQTPFSNSICTEPISIFIVGRVGACVKPADRISQGWRHRDKHPKLNCVVCLFVLFVCVCVRMFLCLLP